MVAAAKALATVVAVAELVETEAPMVAATVGGYWAAPMAAAAVAGYTAQARHLCTTVGTSARGSRCAWRCAPEATRAGNRGRPNRSIARCPGKSDHPHSAQDAEAAARGAAAWWAAETMAATAAVREAVSSVTVETTGAAVTGPAAAAMATEAEERVMVAVEAGERAAARRTARCPCTGPGTRARGRQFGSVR